MHDGDFRVRGKEISRIERLSDAVAALPLLVLVFVCPLGVAA